MSETLIGIEERFERLPLEQVTPSKTNPRSHFDEAYLGELAKSIADKGVVQPILVRPWSTKNGGTYQIVAGECRYRASKLASRADIPAIVRNLTDEQALELQLIENLHRSISRHSSRHGGSGISSTRTRRSTARSRSRSGSACRRSGCGTG